MRVRYCLSFLILCLTWYTFTVKKIKLNTSTTLNDTKIFREIDALSRLSHRNIVRYYTTWIEEVESLSGNSSSASSDSGSGSGDETETEGEDQSADGTVQFTDEELELTNPLSYDINELNVDSGRHSSSFPSIMFTDGDLASTDDEGDSDGSSLGLSNLMDRVPSRGPSSDGTLTPPPRLSRVMYIQMVRYVVILIMIFLLIQYPGICRTSYFARGVFGMAENVICDSFRQLENQRRY